MSTSNKTRILFVSYGGGHIEIIKEIIKEFYNDKTYEVHLLPLTSAIPTINEFQKKYSQVVIHSLENLLPIFGDSVSKILEYGELIFNENFNPNLGISENETKIYLGISLYDLVKEYGERLALEKYNIQKRQAFLPSISLKTILKYINPDLVFTTNSPRMEYAALLAARELNIETYQILDLFGEGYPSPIADNVLVLNENVKNKIQKLYELKYVYVVGQPIFDKTLDEVNDVEKDDVLLKNNLSFDKKILLFSPTKYILRNENNKVIGFGDNDVVNEPVFKILDNLIINHNLQIILRPHPVSDTIENYIKYIKPGYYYFENNELNLYESIAISDYCLTHISTLAIQFMVCNKKVFTYNIPNNEYLIGEYKNTPFIYSETFTDLNKNLLKYINGNHNFDYSVFYNYGAKSRIKKIIDNKLNGIINN